MENDGGEEKGFVGLNVGKARRDIENIDAAMTEIENRFSNFTTSYFDEISTLWFSPRAVEFEGRMKSITDNIAEGIYDFKANLINKCVDAYNAIAPAHGSSPYYYTARKSKEIEYVELKSVGPNSEVGMDVQNVKSATTHYIEKIQELPSYVEDIPKRISFYDTDGGFASACSTNMDNFRGLIEHSINNIIGTISTVIAEEQMRVEKGLSNAQATLGRKA